MTNPNRREGSAQKQSSAENSDTKTAAQQAADKAKKQAQAKAKEKNDKVEIFSNATNTDADVIGKADESISEYKKIICQTFDYTTTKKSYDKQKQKSMCSIIDDYSWTTDTFSKNMSSTDIKYSVASPVPFCYLVQYRQLFSSNITNFINSLVAAKEALTDTSTKTAFEDVGRKIVSLKNTLSNVLNGGPTGKTDGTGGTGGTEQAGGTGTTGTTGGTGEQTGGSGQAGGSGTTGGTGQAGSGGTGGSGGTTTENDANANNVGGYATALSGFITDLAAFASGPVSTIISNGITNSTYLAPYKLLYSLEETKQRYVFPMIAQPPVNKVINTYGEKQEENSLLSQLAIFPWVDKVASGITNFVRDFKDFSHVLGSETGATHYQLSTVEKAKFFNYPTQTQEYTITFPLLNTVKSNSDVPNWKKNYKFILLFTLRNMIYRKDNASFYPPLFYDLIIPGVIRQPFCYVSDFSVKPLGLVQMMSIEKPLSFIDSTLSVAIPEAWIVTIKVKSLLATSANMVLSSLKEMPITASTQ